MIQASDKGRFPQRTLRRAKPAPAKSMVEDAEALIDAKRQYEALGLLRNVPLGHPDIKKATSLRIRAYCETGQMERAEDVFSFASENRVLAQEGCTTLFLAYAEKDPASAECAFARALESEVPRNLVYNAMIYVSVQCGNYVRANSLLLEAEREGAADCHTYGLVIALHMRINDFGGARQLFSRALDAGHANEAMCLKIAEFCKRKGARNAALGVLHTAARKGLGSERLQRELEELEGQPGAGVSIVQRVLGESSEEARNCNGRIAYYLARGEVEPARRVFEAEAAKNLVDEPVYVLMMDAYLTVGDTYAARQVFNVALKNHRADEGIFCVMVSAYLAHDKYVEAKEVVLQAHEQLSSCEALYDKLFNGVYAIKRYHTILYFISELPAQVQEMPPLMLWKIAVLRKMKRYSLAITMADSLLGRPGLEREYVQRTRITKAYAMTYCGRANEAFGILDEVLKETGPDRGYYCKALCGLAFSYAAAPQSVVFPIDARQALLEKIEPLRGTKNPSTNRELEAARGYILESLEHQF